MNPVNHSRALLLLLASILALSIWTQPILGQPLTKEEVARKQAMHPETLNADPRIFAHSVPYSEGVRLNCYGHGVEQAGDVVTQGKLPEVGADGPSQYLVYVLLTDFDTLGVAAVQFGVAFDPKPLSGADIILWQDCADLEFRNEDWPLAGTGNLLTWDWTHNCQKEEPIVVGFFLVDVYGEDEFRIIPRPVDNIGSIVHCNSHVMVDIPREHMGKISYGSGKGLNPWQAEEKD